MEEELFDLPDTQTQECVDSLPPQSQETVKPWGRLSALSPSLASVDLYETLYLAGRDKRTCNIVIESPHLPYLLNISKAHFKITKENDIVYITDLSKNGTFVNSKKVGRNKRNIIHSGDIIALGQPTARVYIFNCNLSETLNLPQQLRKKYFVSRLLGQGAVGEVRFALDKHTCEEYAIKKIFKSRSSSDLAHLNHPQKIRTEIEILRTLSHPFIIHMEDAFETEREVFLILEYMKGGVLTQRILSVIPLPEAEVKFIFYQMLLAVQYLHRNGVTHRDLKPENVLLATDDVYPMIKISDFGLSKITDEVSLMGTVCGTINYVAPEIVGHQGKYSNKVDIWSLGVILFYMLCKELPFRADERADIIKNILKGNVGWEDRRWGNTSFAAKDIVKKMLTVNPARRITVDDVFKHPWIRQDNVMQCQVQRLISKTNGSDLCDSSSSDDLYSPPSKRHCSI